MNILPPALPPLIDETQIRELRDSENAWYRRPGNGRYVFPTESAKAAAADFIQSLERMEKDCTREQRKRIEAIRRRYAR